MWVWVCVLMQILSFCDREIISNLTYDMQSNGARFLLGETIKNVEVRASVC